MRTLSIFLIGTHHDKAEEYNLLVVLYQLVDAIEIHTKGSTLDGAMNIVPKRDYKLIFDGAPDFPGPAATHMQEVTRAALEVIIALGDPGRLTVNIVGHSRGAITAVMIASHFSGSVKPSFNLVLVDPVRRAPIPDQESLILGANVKECLEFVMEDEGSAPIPRSDRPLFKLAKIERKEGTPIKYWRLPGTHGTATQCNPLTTGGQLVGAVSALELLDKDIWPIGGVALRTILRTLQRWGSPLLRGVSTRQIDDEARFREYQRILSENGHRAVRREPLDHGVPLDQAVPRVQVRLQRSVNDVLAKRGEVQAVSFVQGLRDEETFRENGVPANPFRGSPLFVNEQHFSLFEKLVPLAAGDSDAVLSAIARIKSSQETDAPELLPVGADQPTRYDLITGLCSISHRMPIIWSGLMAHLKFEGRDLDELPCG